MEESTASNAGQVESWIEGRMDASTRESGASGEPVQSPVDPAPDTETENVYRSLATGRDKESDAISIPAMVAIVGVVVTQEQEVGATQEAVEVTQEAVEVTREAVEVTQEAVEVTQEAVEVTQEAVEVTRDTEVEVIQVPEVMEAAAGQVGSGILGDTGQHAPEHAALAIRSGSDCAPAMALETVKAKPLS